ncbi:MAG: ROK family protein [Anaerolineales bacterium]
MSQVFAGIEAGGTKWVCMIANHPGDIRATTRFQTSDPEETIETAIEFIKGQTRKPEDLTGLGIGSFGPLDLNRDSDTYGFLTTTPKPGWANTDLISPFHEAFNLPIGFDTDVNAAALGEQRWGAGRGLSDFIYLTVGTGIGGAALANGKLIHGMIHPEMGHTRIPHDWERDPFPGVCPYHGDCLEGLATGPAIQARWNQPAEDLPPEHPAWQLEANYLALGITNLIATLSPQRIILGGGVMDQEHLFPMIRSKVRELLGNYISAQEILETNERYIVPPSLGSQSGVLGAIALAQQAAKA